MKISFKNNIKHSYNTDKKTKPFNKKKATIIAASSLLLTGAMLLANYNRTKIIKKPIEKLTEEIIPQNKEKFLNFCKSMKMENYVANEENIKNKIFRVDLHSHSNHSDGWGNVSDILNQVATYANEVYQKTGKKFTFALTDHDRISGIREANEIINNNPDKFKNVNFIPGVELSFSFNSGGEIKTGELLAYFIDPNSTSMQILVENLNVNRLKMINNFFEKIGKEFSRREMDNYFLNYDGETFAYNLHYRLRNYAQIKNRVNKIAQKNGENASQLYKKLMDGFVFGEKRIAKPFVSPEGFDYYLQKINYKNDVPIWDKQIDAICDEFFPKIVDNKIVSDTENSFEKIIDILKNDENVVLGFAHPYFTAKQMNNFRNEFDRLLEYANGKIQLCENYHQAYCSTISQAEIKEINDYLSKKGLIPMGGRDNHNSSFL